MAENAIENFFLLNKVKLSLTSELFAKFSITAGSKCSHEYIPKISGKIATSAPIYFVIGKQQLRRFQRTQISKIKRIVYKYNKKVNKFIQAMAAFILCVKNKKYCNIRDIFNIIIQYVEQSGLHHIAIKWYSCNGTYSTDGREISMIHQLGNQIYYFADILEVYVI